MAGGWRRQIPWDLRIIQAIIHILSEELAKVNQHLVVLYITYYKNQGTPNTNFLRNKFQLSIPSRKLQI